MRMATLLEEVRKKEEGFASDAQRRAAFASGYKEKDKKKEEVTEKFSSGMIDKLRKAYEPLKGKKIPPAPLMKIFDKIDSNKAGLIQLYKADIPFVSMMAMSRLMLKHDMKADEINKLGKIRKEDFVLDEKKLGYALVVQQKDGSREIVAKGSKNDMRSAAKKHGGLKQGKVFTTLTAKEVGDKVIGIGEEVNEKFTKKDFRDNEDINHHTENGVEIVNMFGTSAEKVKMAGIAARHNMKGGISSKDQKDRDALVKKYYPKLESVELDEMDMKYVLINMQGKVQGYASDKKDALDIAKRTKSTMHPIKKKISDKTLEKMNALAKTPKELQDLGIIEEVLPGHTVQSVEYKFKDKNEAMKAKKVLLKYFNSVDDEDINRGVIIVDAGRRDMNKEHEEIMKKFRPKVLSGRKIDRKGNVLDMKEEVDESLWANIHKKRQRIKQGSGERMRKKGEKGAPSAAQLKRAKGEEALRKVKGTDNLYEPKKMSKSARVRSMMDYLGKRDKKDAEKRKKDKNTSDYKMRMFNQMENIWGEVTEKDDKSGKELNNPTRGDVKKYKVYVKNDKGNVVKVEFGDPNMEIKRDDPERRKSFRARHNCDNPGPKYKARYWSCKFWSAKSVSDLMKG